MKNLILLLFLSISVACISQTHIESTIMLEINKIRKDPKSYILVVESYIASQENALRNHDQLTKSGGLVVKSNVDIASIYKKNILCAKGLIDSLGKAESLDTLKFNENLYTEETSKLPKDYNFFSSEDSISHRNRFNRYIKNNHNVSEVVMQKTKNEDALLKLMLRSNILYSSEYNFNSMSIALGDSILVLHLVSDEIKTVVVESRDRMPVVKTFFRQLFL